MGGNPSGSLSSLSRSSFSCFIFYSVCWFQGLEPKTSRLFLKHWPLVWFVDINLILYVNNHNIYDNNISDFVRDRTIQSWTYFHFCPWSTNIYQDWDRYSMCNITMYWKTRTRQLNHMNNRLVFWVIFPKGWLIIYHRRLQDIEDLLFANLCSFLSWI